MFFSRLAQICANYTGGKIADAWGWTVPFYVGLFLSIFGFFISVGISEVRPEKSSDLTFQEVLRVAPDLPSSSGARQHLFRLGRTQDALREVATNGLVVNLSGKACAANATAPAPKLAPLCGDILGRSARSGRSGFTLDVAAQLADLSPGQVLLDSRDASGKGYVLQTAERGTVQFQMCDGWALSPGRREAAISDSA
jgi:hypothetical protein